MPDSGGANSSCRKALRTNGRSKGQIGDKLTSQKPAKKCKKGHFFTDLTYCGQTRKSTRGTAKTKFFC